MMKIGIGRRVFHALGAMALTCTRSVVAAGAAQQEPDPTKEFALHAAVERSDTNAVIAGMRAGLDPRRRDSRGFSPFFIAAVVKRDLGLAALLMNTNDNSASARGYADVDMGSDRQAPAPFSDTASLVQWNPRFGYRFIASPDWLLYGRQQDGLFSRRSIVVFELPAIWSDAEGQDIKNSISIYAAEDPEVTSLATCVSAFRQSNRDIEVVAEKIGADAASFDYRKKDNSLTYRLRSVLAYRHGISYRMDFTATPGTFDANEKLFAAFCDSVVFSAPQRARAGE